MTKPTGNITTITEAKEDRKLAFNKQQYGDLIHARRTFLKLSQAELARRLGVQKAYVTHWEAGRARPDLNLVPALCRELDISVATFFGVPAADGLTDAERVHMTIYRSLGKHDRMVLDTTLARMAELASIELFERCRTDFLPIYHNYQKAAAGSGEQLEADDQGEEIMIRRNFLSEHSNEIVTIHGQSMEPDYPDGRDVYIEHTPTLEFGEIGLFVVNGDGFIKEYQDGYLHSLNPDYPDIRLHESDNARIVGRVLGLVDPSDYPTREEQEALEEIKRESK